MSKITDQLRASGVAQVIVVLDASKEGAAASSRRDQFKSIEKHFDTNGEDQHSAIVEDGFVAAAGPSRVMWGARRSKAASRRAPKAAAPVQFFRNLGIAYGVVDRAGLAALRSDSNVKSVTGAPQLSLVRPVSSTPADGLTRKVAWGIQELKIPELWKQGLKGNGMLIAHLDTGIDGHHPALLGAIKAFVEVDRLGRQTPASVQPFDTGTHGTHTAGTLVGRPDSEGRAIGVAPEAQLASAIVIESGDTVARVLSGLDWALGQGAQILSMSLGIRGYWRDFLPIIQILRRRGLLPVIAAGNEGPQTSRSPGNYVEALSVGWANRDHQIDPESSSQHFDRKTDPIVPDLVGPGGDIVSSKPGGGYQLMSGTSMATPHIAGLAALLWEAKPDATLTEIERALLDSCTPLAGVSASRQGRGFPDAVVALTMLQNG